MIHSTVLIEPETHFFSDDGSIPNNARLPFLLYRGAIDLKGSPDPENVIERTFAANKWRDMWRNGISPYAHYHSKIHEVMGIARGRARARFGGNAGRDIDLCAGDVAVLPAGTGHQCLWASPDLIVIGAYPPAGKFDLCRGSRGEHEKAIVAIREVPPPTSDPIYGIDGPLPKLWCP